MKNKNIYAKISVLFSHITLQVYIFIFILSFITTECLIYLSVNTQEFN